jgi:tRNA (guanosine-2'-O-)-methyltransferase
VPASADPLATLPADLQALALEVGAARTGRVLAALQARVGSLVPVMEAVRRRHNASAILRSAEVFGIHEVHLVTQGFTPSPGASRASERWVELRKFDSTLACFEDLRARGFRVVVADLLPVAWTPETLPIDRPVAILFGSEFTGVSAWARDHADGCVQVPMHGLTRSLNVSVSAAIVLRAVSERIRAERGPDLAEAARERFLRDWLEGEVKARAGWLGRTGGADGI